MSRSNQNQLVEVEWKHDRRKGDHSKGNKWAAIPYDEKLIRDELKTNIYKAVRGLNMTVEDADKYYQQEERTVLEKLFYDAAKAKQWSVIERFFERVIGTPAIKQVDTNLEQPQKLNLKNLNDDELRTLRDLHRKVAGS